MLQDEVDVVSDLRNLRGVEPGSPVFKYILYNYQQSTLKSFQSISTLNSRRPTYNPQLPSPKLPTPHFPDRKSQLSLSTLKPQLPNQPTAWRRVPIPFSSRTRLKFFYRDTGNLGQSEHAIPRRECRYRKPCHREGVL